MNGYKDLIVIGAGGHGRVAADIARQRGYRVFFLDDNRQPVLPVIGAVADYARYLDKACFFVGIGNNQIRKKIQTMLQESSAEVVSLIHPRAVVAEDCTVGAGSVIMAGAVVNTGARLGSGVIVNTSASVDHDCEIGDYVHVSVGSHIAGTVTVGERTFVGAGATVINNITVCGECMIGAGAVVVRDIDTAGTYMGVPARRVR